ncbi:hypothetical protein [Hoeflea prorocentri]|uniref:ATP-grasp domain-containing protein n=1 Tax=Hoeflea prorocentri TaxID=1922333 RepID=A0A9X3UMA5_9HYPH|nr:hypothetical protein [Hoeflea prorocentri]MCY6383470.1 hypothetical protein [Hoeflea prorocentri]MDA5401270.1 hypothetical protein [Hoeflea prorocentri]
MTLPELTAIYPPGTFLAPRLEDPSAKWVPSDLHAVEFMTANLIACAGGFPMLVHKAAMSPDGLELMERCGVNIGSAIETYETPDDYHNALMRRIEDGQTAVFVYPSSVQLPEKKAALVASDCLAHLNNKQNIAQLSGPENIPRRRTIDNGSRDQRDTLVAPIALKIATNEPNAGGLDVAICRRRRHIDRALSRFADAETLIAEELIEAVRNWCVQFAVTADGTVCEIGATEQICIRSGIHAGNLYAVDASPEENVLTIGRSIAEAGSKLGFRGLCGFDILLDRHGKAFVIDLNFRPVSSSAFLYEALRRSNLGTGARFARLAFCRSEGTLAQMIRRCDQGFRDGWIIPLATFEPEFGGLKGGTARMRLMIVADSLKVLHRREQSLAGCGVDFVHMPNRFEQLKHWFRNVI